MRSTELAKRNVKEVIRDPLSLGIALALPLLLLLTLQALGGDDTPFLTPTLLTPGIVLFGFVMVMRSCRPPCCWPWERCSASTAMDQWLSLRWSWR